MIGIVEDFVTEDQEQELVSGILGLMERDDPVKSEIHRSRVLRYGYDYSEKKKFLRPIPAWIYLQKLTWLFDSVTVNEYPPGRGIGKHVDVDCFGDPIVILSLNSGATMITYPKSFPPSKEFLPRRSIALLSGDSRMVPHEITAETEDTDRSGKVVPRNTRYSVVFRKYKEESIHDSISAV